MRIGLVDYDFIEIPQSKTLNVELMKIGNYYESYGHEVKAVTPLDNIFSYDKLIIGSSRIGNITKIKKIELHPNKEFIGPGFNNWNYIPTGIQEVDYGKVNNKYYKDLYNYNLNNYRIKNLNKVFDKKWIRLFPNNSPIELKTILTGEKYNIVDTYIFDKENWEETLLNLSIYYKYYTFVYPQIVRNTQDLNNFIKMLKFKFINLKCAILIQDFEEFKQFCSENKDKLNKYATSIYYVIGYDKNNIYSEQFYLEEVINTLRKIKLLNDEGIIVKHEGLRIDYSKHYFTSQVFEALKIFIVTNKNNNQTFHQVFLMKNRRDTRVIQKYYHFMNAKQEYYYLFSRKFKKEGAELC